MASLSSHQATLTVNLVLVQKSADLGGILGDIVVGAMEGFTSANNKLMEGNNYDGTGDILNYFLGGSFVDFGGVGKNNVINAMNAFLLGQSINQLWRTQVAPVQASFFAAD